MKCRTGPLLMAGMVLLGGCAAWRAPTGDAERRVAEPRAARAYPQVEHVLAGFDQPAQDAEWHVGDQLLFALTFERDGRRELRFVRVMLKTGALPPETRVVVVPEAEQSASPPVGPAELAVVHPQPPGAEQLTVRMAAYESRSTIRRAGGDAVQLARYSRPVLLAVDVFAADGELEGSSFISAPELVLRTGMYDGTRLFLELGAGDAAPEAAAAAAANEHAELLGHAHDLAAALESLQRTVSACESLHPLLARLAPRPSLFSLLRYGGVQSHLALVLSEFSRAKGVPPATSPDAPPLILPLVITMNKESVIRCDLAVVPARPPLHLTAGVVALEAWMPRAPDRRVHAELLAARRGSQPAETLGH